MNTTATQPRTTLELLTENQTSTNPSFFSMLEPLDTSTIPTFTQLLAEYTATIDKPDAARGFLNTAASVDPFAIYQTNLAEAHPQPVRWLWHKRLPLAGINLVDGDHACGKSLLVHQIAAAVSAGTPMPDGSTTIQGGVIIVTSHTDATIQLLTALGADLSRVEILSYIQDSAPSSRIGSYRPFSIPEDFTRLFQAVKRIDARLIIFDPFVSLLSRKSRWTDQRLCHLLADLKLHLIEHNVACLITRNCHAKGGHARPSVLERSDHFVNIATSRLLLAPDPMQPDRLLLSHATSRHAALTPTLVLQIQPRPDNPDLPHITHLGSHSLQAKDLINCRPDTLHRQLLSQHLLQIITAATDPIPVSTLYALSPHSSAFQIQRALSDLLHMGQIQRPTRGFYAPAPPNPVLPFKQTAATTQMGESTEELKQTAATTQMGESTEELKQTAVTTQMGESTEDTTVALLN